MTYGDDKIKDIAEGILPATRNAARAARRARRGIHKTARARSRMELIAGGDGAVASTLARHELVTQMWRRREADNLSTLFRWAQRRTLHISDPEERYLVIQSVLPRNLIGRHALSHIAYLDGFKKPGDEDQGWRYEREDPSERATRLGGEHRRSAEALGELPQSSLARSMPGSRPTPPAPAPVRTLEGSPATAALVCSVVSMMSMRSSVRTRSRPPPS